MGPVKNSAGKAIAINGLWGLEFGGGSSTEWQDEPVVLYGWAERHERILRSDRVRQVSFQRTQPEGRLRGRPF